MTNTKRAALSNALARYAATAIEHGADADIQVALDAATEGRADAHTLVIGMPVTWSNGRDRFADKIASATPSLLTITLECGKVFRFTGSYFTQGKHRFLSMVGAGEEYRDECF